MKVILKEKTRHTPLLQINADEVYIEGRSIPEDAYEFYQPLFDDFALKLDHTKEWVVKLKLDYFNTSSSGLIMKYFKILEKAKIEGMPVSVFWYHADYDEDMLEAGHDFDDVVPKLGLNIISYAS